MSQHDGVISDQAGATFLTELNEALAAVISNHSGATAPEATLAYQPWADTTSGWLKLRNAANDNWVNVCPLTGLDPATAKTNSAQSWSAKQTIAATLKVQQALEKITIAAAAPAATQNFDWLTQAIQYFTTNGANNWTLNVRGDGTTSLNSLMATGESATLTVMATMGATPYYASAMTVDGASVTPKWLGGSAPTSGDASCINVYTYTIIKTADAIFTVVASKARTS